MKNNDWSGESASLYRQLPEFASKRFEEISGMSQPYIDVTDRFGSLVVRIISQLGKVAPKNVQDIVVRDLSADVFDFLYEARLQVLGGKLPIAYPLIRRAFESISLLHLCTLSSEWAEKWHKRAKIENSEVRRELGKLPMGEPENLTKESYKFFCQATHPNRDLIPERYLGDGNRFVLGLIGRPDLFMVCDYCAKHLDLYLWFVATLSYFYRDVYLENDKDYLEEYMQAHKQAKAVKRWLVENQIRLHEEFMRTRNHHQ